MNHQLQRIIKATELTAIARSSSPITKFVEFNKPAKVTQDITIACTNTHNSNAILKFHLQMYQMLLQACSSTEIASSYI